MAAGGAQRKARIIENGISIQISINKTMCLLYISLYTTIGEIPRGILTFSSSMDIDTGKDQPCLKLLFNPDIFE
jgi:hypothetical protein